MHNLEDLNNGGPLRARLIAFYLPQFYPIPENDEWWGKGFTEWTNVTKAKPLFGGHYQPDLPSDLGFYDLRVPDVRQAQADLAKANGIEGFCYWHYWFGNGRRILDRVFTEVLESGQPDLPFCLGWANQTWSGIWHGLTNKILIEQKYPGEQDHRAHFELLLRAFKDPRYIRVDGKPLLVIYRPHELPNSNAVFSLWRKMADENGLAGICIAGITENSNFPAENRGYDMFIPHEPARFSASKPFGARKPVDSILSAVFRRVRNKLRRKKGPTNISYRAKAKAYLKTPKVGPDWFECVMPNWDNTPRSARNGMVFPDAQPGLYRQVLRKAISDLADRPAAQRIIFLKSWNEWAEGNYLEPGIKFGHQFLDVTREEVSAKNS
jgi:hypothetical protein